MKSCVPPLCLPLTPRSSTGSSFRPPPAGSPSRPQRPRDDRCPIRALHRASAEPVDRLLRAPLFPRQDGAQGGQGAGFVRLAALSSLYLPSLRPAMRKRTRQRGTEARANPCLTRSQQDLPHLLLPHVPDPALAVVWARLGKGERQDGRDQLLVPRAGRSAQGRRRREVRRVWGEVPRACCPVAP